MRFCSIRFLVAQVVFSRLVVVLIDHGRVHSQRVFHGGQEWFRNLCQLAITFFGQELLGWTAMSC